MIRVFSLVLLLLTLPGCKLLIIVTNGGSVNANIASTNCAALTNCEFDIVDSTFVEEYEAIPDPGYQFVNWYDAPGFLCPGSTNPLCIIDNTLLAGLVPDAAIADGPNIYAMAVFTDKAPIRDTVTAADGREWAQPFRFTNLSWSEINAVCPLSNNGICDGSLNGWDMHGWIWGNSTDVAALFNAYGITPPVVYQGPPVFECESVWMDAFIADNWLSTQDPMVPPTLFVVHGFVAEPPNGSGFVSWGTMAAEEFFSCTAREDAAGIRFYQATTSYKSASHGAFFYRAP